MLEQKHGLAGERAVMALSALLIFAAAGCAALLSAHRYFNGGQSYEFCHYSEIASNLLDGKGFVSSSQTGGNLAFLDAQGRACGTECFEASRFPLQAVLFAAMQFVFGRGDFAGLAAVSLIHALWAAVIFLCGSVFFSPLAAFCAALLWALNPALTAGLVPGGFPDLLSGLLCTLAAFMFILGLQKRAEGRWFFLTGILCGLAYLSRFTVEIFLPLFPLFAVLALGWKRGLLVCVFMVLGALLPVLPWTLYVMHMTGVAAPPLFWTQLAAHSITGPIPWHEYRVFTSRDFAFPGVAALLANKWLKNFLSLAHELPALWFLYLAWPLALTFGLKTFVGKSNLRHLLGFYVAAFLLQALGFSLLRHETLGFISGRYYLWCGPLVLLSAAQFIYEARLPVFSAKSLLGVFVAANIAVYSYCYFKIEPAGGNQVMNWTELRWAAELPPGAVVLTNMPAQVSWYGKKAAISLPPTPESLPELLKKHNADYALLSPSAAGEQWNYPAWGAIARLEPQALNRLEAETGFTLRRSEYGVLLFERQATSAPARLRQAGPARALSHS